MATKSAAARFALAACACVLLQGCFTFQHTVGRGPMSTPPVVAAERQWFWLWGLMPIGDHDSATLAGSAHDYRVTTEFTFSDVVISALTSFVSFYRQTIIVEK